MALTLLLEKYDVSTEEGLQKALSEIEKEEAEVDEALSGVLSRACTVSGKLRAASGAQAQARLADARAHAVAAADMVQRTADLATDVSAKVRQLDLARSRVAECQRRVHDLIDLQLCSAGVDAALAANDLDTAAGHVSRFLSMDPRSVAAARARGAPDPRRDMTRAATTLREHLVLKFEEAARKEDEASVEHLFKLFPQIGKAEEGVDLLANYIAKQTEIGIRRACSVAEPQSEAAVFADALTRVLEAGGAAVERARQALALACPALLPRAVAIIQPVVCAGARAVFSRQLRARRLDSRPPSALAAEPALAELAAAHDTLRLYFGFLRSRARPQESSLLSEEDRKRCVQEVEKIILECDLMRTAQDILGHYLELERYFLEESVNKALKMAAPQVGATTSSLVDDVFYIARKVIRRSVSTGSVDGACAVLNEVSALLERSVAAALRRWLRAPPPDPLPLAPPAPPGPPGAAAAAGAIDAMGTLAQKLNRDVDAQRMLFLAHMNEAEAGAEWSERLAAEACAEAEHLLRSRSERDKLVSCAGGLAGAAAAFRAAHELALAGVAAALKPRAAAWAELVAGPGEPDDLEDDADLLPAALDAFLAAAQGQLSPAASAHLVAAWVTALAERVDRVILHNSYDRAGALCVERRVRRLSSWAGGGAAAARERCAALTQAAALLALERPAHAHDALRPRARLAPRAVRDILARRTDFKMEDIKRLKL